MGRGDGQTAPVTRIIYTRRMFNIIGERERPNPSCQPSYCTIEAHPGPTAMRITVFEGLTSSDSCRMCLNSYYCRGGIGLCMPIEVISLYGRMIS